MVRDYFERWELFQKRVREMTAREGDEEWLVLCTRVANMSY